MQNHDLVLRFKSEAKIYRIWTQSYDLVLRFKSEAKVYRIWTQNYDLVSYTNSHDSFIKADRIGCETQLEQISAQRKQF